MPRVVLVSRNPVLAFGLTGAGCDVTEVAPSRLAQWLDDEGDIGYDALVIDVGDARTAADTVGDLRARGHWIPVVLLAGGAPDALAALPRTTVVATPVTAQRLSDALRTALSGQRPAQPVEELLTDPAPVHGEPLLDPVPDLVTGDEPAWLLADPNGAATSAAPTPRTPRPQPAGPPPVVGRRPEDDLRSTLLTSGSSRRRRQRLADRTSGTPAGPALDGAATSSGAHASSPPGPGAAPMVQALLAALPEVFGVAETAQAVVADAAARVPCDGVALLVPDGDVWRVSAGQGLRPLETRYQLTADAWLTSTVAAHGKGVIVEHTDVARNVLRGAPLASRTHLLAVPIPDADAMLLMARDEEPAFDEQTLATLAQLAREAGPLLVDAVAVRTLARSLADHRDDP